MRHVKTTVPAGKPGARLHGAEWARTSDLSRAAAMIPEKI